MPGMVSHLEELSHVKEKRMTDMQKTMAVFSGSVNPSLAEGIADHLGISLGNVKLEKFANGEI